MRRWPGGASRRSLLADPDWRGPARRSSGVGARARSDAGRLTLDSDVIRAARLLPKNLAHGSLEPLARGSSGCSARWGSVTGASLRSSFPSLCAPSLPAGTGRMRGLGGADAEGCQEHARGQRNGRSRAQRHQASRGASPVAPRRARGNRDVEAVEVWWADPVGDQPNHAPRNGHGDWDEIAPGATKPAHPRADDSVGAVVTCVRREADAAKLRLRGARTSSAPS